jgi:hypothetical protein
LEAEGVLIDAIGAVIAVVALEVAIEPSGESLERGFVGIAVRLGIGALAGLAGGFLLWGLLRYRNLISEGLENVFTLALVWMLFKVSEALVHESGVAAVTVAGLVVGNFGTRIHRELAEFNDQLTVMLIGTLFVLLAADVRIAEVTALGWPGLLTVAALIFIVRPANVLMSTAGSTLGWKKRVFISWIGPRGIIAAAIASLFANELDHAGIEGGEKIKAMVFLVIAVTVVVSGLTGGLVARLLGVSRPPRGWLLLGANALACTLAKTLKDGGEEVACLDQSVDHCKLAEEYGVEVVQGNGLDESALEKAKVRLRSGVAAVTANDEVNLLFIKKAREVGNVKRRLAALHSATLGATSEMVHHAGGHVLFRDEHDVALWSSLLANGMAIVEKIPAVGGASLDLGHEGNLLAIPIAHHRGGTVQPISDDVSLRAGDKVTFAVDKLHHADAHRRLEASGFHATPVSELTDPKEEAPREEAPQEEAEEETDAQPS